MQQDLLVGVLVSYATKMCLGRRIDFAEKLVTGIQNGYDGRSLIMLCALDAIWQDSSSTLSSTVLIPWAAAATKMQCLLCGLSKLCRAKQIGRELPSSSLDGLPRGAATGYVLVRIRWSGCVADRAAYGWDCHQKTLRLAGKIWHIKLLVREVPSSIFTSRLWTMQNHSQMQKSSRRARRFCFFRTELFLGCSGRWGFF